MKWVYCRCEFQRCSESPLMFQEMLDFSRNPIPPEKTFPDRSPEWIYFSKNLLSHIFLFCKILHVQYCVCSNKSKLFVSFLLNDFIDQNCLIWNEFVSVKLSDLIRSISKDL